MLKQEAGVLLAEDFGIMEAPTLGDHEERLRIMEEVSGLIGMDESAGVKAGCFSPKQFFAEIDHAVQYVEKVASMAAREAGHPLTVALLERGET